MLTKTLPSPSNNVVKNEQLSGLGKLYTAHKNQHCLGERGEGFDFILIALSVPRLLTSILNILLMFSFAHRCLCNGHADSCSENGKCPCSNNTMEDCPNTEDCYKNQVCYFFIFLFFCFCACCFILVLLFV